MIAHLAHDRLVHFAALIFLLIGITAAPVAAQSETIEYYGLDALGSVRVIFNAQGAVVDRMDCGPFGENLRAAIKFPVEQFAQLARDAESGQDYAQARNYAPSTGRFNRVDPVYRGLFEPQKWNRYSYTRSNPINFVDPSGLDECANPRPNLICRTITGKGDSPAPVVSLTSSIPSSLAAISFLTNPREFLTRAPRDRTRRRTGDAPSGFEGVIEKVKELACAALPSGGTVALGGSIGGPASTTAAGELVTNYQTGEVSFFRAIGMQAG